MPVVPRPLIVRLRVMACLLLAVPLLAEAGKEERDFLNTVYKGKGSTLYCREPLDASARFKLDLIYSEKQLLQHFGCITSRQCERNDGFARAAGDLHNQYPIERGVYMDRRGSNFDDSPDNVALKECGYSLSYQVFEPPDHAKGNVARALFYMHTEHKLPLPSSATLLKQWHEVDPPDEEEKARNLAIGQQQGNGNPYIDDPSSVEAITGLRRSW